MNTEPNEPPNWYELGANLGRSLAGLGLVDVGQWAKGFAAGREVGIVAAEHALEIEGVPWLIAVAIVADTVRPEDSRQWLLDAGRAGRFGPIDEAALLEAVLA